MQILSTLLLALLPILETCNANFDFTFDLNNFRTSGNCFGDDLTGACETYLLIFCLREPRPANQQSTDINDCPLGSSPRADGPNVAITRTIQSSEPWPGAFQMFIRARDEDIPGFDDDLDAIFINLDLAPSAGYTTTMDYIGRSNRVTVNMRFQVTCSTNYFGDDCNTFCMAMDNDVNGHYICNTDGSIQCIAGYTGQNCKIEIDECQTEPCQNGGNCTDLLADYSCECVLGFEDKNCSTDRDDCVDIECAGNSTCLDFLNGFECMCNAGFEEPNCTDIINPCEESPCGQGSSCVAINPFSHTCICALGFSGSDCSNNIDDCAEISCSENSHCVDGIASSQCECNEGFQGDACSSIASQRVVVITGAVVGGVAGILILLVFVVIVAACMIATKRSKRNVPDNFTTAVEADNVYASVENGASSRVDTTEGIADKGLTDNPLYGGFNPTSPVDVTYTTPNVSYTAFNSPDTLYKVENPIYGYDGTSTAAPIYSEPGKVDLAVDVPTPADPNYSYARVNGARNENAYANAGDVTLSSTGSVLYKKFGDQTS